MKIIKSRIFKALTLIVMISILLGIISFIITNKKEIKSDLINYITLIKNGKFNYTNSLITSLFNNFKYSFLIWIFGIIFIFSFISILLIVYKGISLGFMLSGIIYTFKVKGLLYGLILSIPCILNIFIYIVLAYYSINFSIKSLNAFRNNRQINYKSFYINYIYIYLILLIILIISSLIETYICSNLLKFVL
jgi:stage II sporulation protein M